MFMSLFHKFRCDLHCTIPVSGFMHYYLRFILFQSTLLSLFSTLDGFSYVVERGDSVCLHTHTSAHSGSGTIAAWDAWIHFAHGSDTHGLAETRSIPALSCIDRLI